MTTKVGILQTGHLDGYLGETYGQYPQMFKNLLAPEPFEYKIYKVVEGEFPKSPTECDGWIITGSKHGVYENHDWIKPLEAFCRQLVASNRPTVGICFGHQILAQAMGAKVSKFEGGWGVGLNEYVMSDTGETVRLLAFHQDQVLEQPENTEIIMSSYFCKIAGLKYSPTCYSIQPHPEHTVPFITDLIKIRRGKALPEDIADDALAKPYEPNDQARFGEMMANVLDGDLRL